MPDYLTELRHLRKADLDIAKAKAAVFMQKAVVHRLQTDGHDAAHAQELLDIMVHGLDVLERLRAMVIEKVADIERRGGHELARSLAGLQSSPSSMPWRPRLGVAQKLLEDYQSAVAENHRAQRLAMAARSGTAPAQAPSAHELLALGQREHDALAAFLDEVDRCAQACEWPG